MRDRGSPDPVVGVLDEEAPELGQGDILHGPVDFTYKNEEDPSLDRPVVPLW